MPYRIVNWEKHQARSDRDSNPWVKLHRTILTSADFFAIPKARRWEWPLLLLFANHSTGIIEDSDEAIAFKLHYKDGETWNCKPFIGKLLEEVATTGTPLVTTGCLEERREEETEKKRKDLCPAPLRGARPEPEKFFEDPANLLTALEFPIKGNNGVWLCPQEKFDQWARVYGDSMDVSREILKARQWLLDNPRRQKTVRGMASFIGTWLSAAQNKGTGSRQSEPKSDRIHMPDNLKGQSL